MLELCKLTSNFLFVSDVVKSETVEDDEEEGGARSHSVLPCCAANALGFMAQGKLVGSDTLGGVASAAIDMSWD